MSIIKKIEVFLANQLQKHIYSIDQLNFNKSNEKTYFEQTIGFNAYYLVSLILIIIFLIFLTSIIKIISLIFWLPFIFLCYRFIMYCLKNNKQVLITSNEIHIKFKLLPNMNNQIILKSEIIDIIPTRGILCLGGKILMSFDLFIKLKSGKIIKLISNINEDTFKFLYNEIKNWSSYKNLQ